MSRLETELLYHLREIMLLERTVSILGTTTYPKQPWWDEGEFDAGINRGVNCLRELILQKEYELVELASWCRDTLREEEVSPAAAPILAKLYQASTIRPDIHKEYQLGNRHHFRLSLEQHKLVEQCVVLYKKDEIQLGAARAEGIIKVLEALDTL